MASASKTFRPVFPGAQERGAQTKQPAGLPAHGSREPPRQPKLPRVSGFIAVFPPPVPAMSRLAKKPPKSTSSSLTFMCGLAVGLMCPELYPKRHKQRAHLALSGSGWEGSAPHRHSHGHLVCVCNGAFRELAKSGEGRGQCWVSSGTTSENHGLR